MSKAIQKIKAIIVDDEEDAIDSLKFSLQNYCPEVELIATSDSIDDAYEKIKSLKVELVFLDINLNDVLVFKLLNLFNPIPFHIIFITAFDQFAIQAIKYSALDYILKPVHKEELKAAVEKAMKAKASQVSVKLLEEQLIEKAFSNKIAINSGRKTIVVKMEEIVYCFAEDNYCWVFLANGEKHLSSHYLIYFEELLPDNLFFKIHRSYLINLNYVKSYSEKMGVVTLLNLNELPVSFRKRKLFIEVLAKSFTNK